MVKFLRAVIHEFCITEGFSDDFYVATANWVSSTFGAASSSYFSNVVEGTDGKFYIPVVVGDKDDSVDEIIRTILELADY